MKRFTMVLTAAVLALMTVAFAACKRTTPLSQVEGGAQADDHLQRILKSGKLVIGSELITQPIQFKDQNGTPQGLIVDMMNEAAKEMGVTIEWVDLPWDSLIPSLTSGKIDMVAANMSVTLKRWTTIRFSHPYMLTGVGVLVKKGSGVQDWRELMVPPRKLGTTMGSAHLAYIKDKFNYDASAYESWIDGSNVVKTGGIDGMMDDELLLMEFVKQNPDTMMLLPELVRPDAYALGFRQGISEDTLVRWFDWFITWEKLTGFYGDVYKKWIGKDWVPDPIIQ